MTSAIRYLTLSATFLINASCQSAPPASPQSLELKRRSLATFSVVEENDELNSKERLSWIQGRKNYLKSLYQVTLDPYFGKSDEHVNSCKTKSVKLVEEKSNRDAAYVSYLILTTDGGATGVCDSKMQTHRMAMVFASCANRNLQFTMKVICPVSADLASQGCNISEPQVITYCTDRVFSGAEN